jgi:pimeloyl-ACP methyl ester carboxylesterase
MTAVQYRRSGSGPPLVLLHGFLCDSRVWRTQLEELADGFDTIAWDAPGAGDSPDPPEPFTISDWARSLAEFLDSLDVGRAHVLGLSWGGMLALELYRLDPDRVLSLVLADTYAGWKGSLGPEAAAQRLERCVRESELPPEEFTPLWVPEFFTDAAPQELIEEMAAVVGDFHPAGFRLMAKSLADTDQTGLLHEVRVPTLLVWGAEDVRSPLGVARQFHEAIKGSELEVIERAGHVSNMERPDEFNARVRGWLTRAL